VYRGDVEGFTPGPDTLVASGVTELSYTDLGAPTDRAIFYLVRAENDETCGAGPDHGGLTDGNAVYAAAEESTGAELPGVVPGLRVRRVAGDAHIRLRWTSSESAASYRVLRSPTPAPSDFGAIGETPDRVYDDVGAGADRETYFYLVRGLNPCGQAGP
jgi:hypothetical protein